MQMTTPMLTALRERAERTYTENGAVTLTTTRSRCLDLFASIGALRDAPEGSITERFHRAWCEDRDLALRTLFYARDVRGGLGERRVFRVLLRYLAQDHPDSVRKNLEFIPLMGRWDDLLALMDTPCRRAAVDMIRRRLREDLENDAHGRGISLMAKWLPSVNTSDETQVLAGRRLARDLGMTQREYRRTLSRLRARLRILENSLRERDYTFDYALQPSAALFRYRRAFLRNDRERYTAFMDDVSSGRAELHTASLLPSDLIDRALRFSGTPEERRILDVTWEALEDYTDARNALCVVDTSGSMYWYGRPRPAAVALSLGLYFAQRNRGAFHDCFITFSTRPRLITVMGEDLVDRVRYCESFSEAGSTNISAVFDLVLEAAVSRHLPQSEMPDTLYFITDMEFDACAGGANVTNFERARALYRSHGYRLPRVVFWCVQSRREQQPVSMNEQGVALVSGYTPRLFEMVLSDRMDPYQVMTGILNSDRYAGIRA